MFRLAYRGERPIEPHYLLVSSEIFLRIAKTHYGVVFGKFKMSSKGDGISSSDPLNLNGHEVRFSQLKSDA